MLLPRLIAPEKGVGEGVGAWAEAEGAYCLCFAFVTYNTCKLACHCELGRDRKTERGKKNNKKTKLQ